VPSVRYDARGEFGQAGCRRAQSARGEYVHALRGRTDANSARDRRLWSVGVPAGFADAVIRYVHLRNVDFRRPVRARCKQIFTAPDPRQSQILTNHPLSQRMPKCSRRTSRAFFDTIVLGIPISRCLAKHWNYRPLKTVSSNDFPRPLRMRSSSPEPVFTIKQTPCSQSTGTRI
jgi:hypothetical protein